MEKITTNSDQQTHDYGHDFAGKLKGGEILALQGELGSGKTVFAKGLAQGLGVKQTVNSPTFVLMKVYPAQSGNIRNLCHIDAYRLSEGRELISIGAGDYLGNQATVSLIEWPERITDYSLAYTYWLAFKHLDEHTRQITVG